MTDFTVNVAGDGKSTDIEIVGKKIRALAKEFVQSGISATKIYKTSALDDFDVQESGWDQDAVDLANELFDALSVNIYDNGDIVEVIQHTDSPIQKKIREKVKLIFVFEEEGHMVIPIPSNKQILRGTDNAPLASAGVYTKTNIENVVEFLKEELTLMTQLNGTDLRDVFLNQPNNYTTMIKALESIVESVQVNIEQDKEDLFHQQLGDYSVRQCAH